MKLKNLLIPLTITLGFSLLTPAIAQVTTDPVGYVTVTINGTLGNSSEAFTFMGVPLHKPVSSSGAISGVGVNTISVSDAMWDTDEFAMNYIQILSGNAEGFIATIVSNTSDVLTISEDMSGMLTGSESFAIRPYNTIADIFGANNESGLDGGSSAGNADNILIQTEAGFDTYYYKDSGLIGGTGWRSSSSSVTDKAAAIIAPGDGIIIKRSQEADIDLIISGSVFPTNFVNPIEAGFNWKTTSIPITVTIADFFGPLNEAGLDGGSSAGNADNILILNAQAGFDTYYYKDSGLIGGTGWRSSASSITDESAKVLAEPGVMFYINRSGGNAFNLTENSPL